MSPKEKKTTTVKASPKSATVLKGVFLFDKSNYILVILGLVLIALGFFIMSGGGSTDPNVFDESIFNFRRITLAPILVLAGYIIEIYAIMKKPAEQNTGA